MLVRLSCSIIAYSIIKCNAVVVRKDLVDCAKGDYMEEAVSFYIYSRDYSDGQQLHINNITSLSRSVFDNKLDTVFITHGWTHSKEAAWLIEMRTAMAEYKQWNVIVVDWAPLSRTFYIEARVHVNIVGRQLAKFCIFLNLYSGTSLSSIHFIGHSLGAQICGYAGHLLQKELHKKVGRISGLDPAAPLYEYPQEEILDERLDQSDAEFVDVIHTNGNHLGVIHAVGHVDYYPNGGETQPDCLYWACSHMRACELWTTSLKNPDFLKAYKSSSWEEYQQQDNTNSKAYPIGIAAGSYMPRGKYYMTVYKEDISPYIEKETTIIDSIQR